MRLIVTTLLSVIFFIGLCLADAPDAANEWSGKEGQALQATAQGTLDPRLPPVLPGEPVVRGGKKMNMWSTSGPVPVGDAPEPFEDKQRIDVDDVDIIVDQRKNPHPSR